MAALTAANSGHAPGYGADDWTIAASDAIRSAFETDCPVYFVFNGTAANSLALASLCQSYHSVICTPVAHVETDECGGPEFFSNGSKLLVAEGTSEAARRGKLTPDAIEALVTKRSDIHYPKPRVVSLTQATELGTVYTVEEVRAIAAIARIPERQRDADADHIGGIADGGEPATGLLEGLDGLLYGTTNGGTAGGTVFRITSSAWRAVSVVTLSGASSGSQTSTYERYERSFGKNCVLEVTRR